MCLWPGKIAVQKFFYISTDLSSSDSVLVKTLRCECLRKTKTSLHFSCHKNSEKKTFPQKGHGRKITRKRLGKKTFKCLFMSRTDAELKGVSLKVKKWLTRWHIIRYSHNKMYKLLLM